MKKTLLLATLLISFIGYSQKKHSLKIGRVTKDELQLTVYDKDSTANSVVLEEKGNVYLDEENSYNYRTDYYRRIKFFNKKDIEKATVSVYLYKSDKIKDLKAITCTLNNGNTNKVFLLDSQVFTKQVNENVKEVTFTLPNISDGCIIEYSYSVINYSSGLKDWYFQSDIPKIKSDYRAAIPGNWRYNTKVIGYKKLDREDATIKKECLYMPGFSEAGDCLVTEYGMDDVPAFKEEDYMLAKKNYVSRLAFELESFTNTNGSVEKYTKTWKDADKTIKNLFFDNQTSKKNYFKDKLPQEFLSINNPLERAKAIYYHIQDRMYWNGNKWASKKKVKRVYEEKKGSVDAINLTLYNALQAFDIECYMAVLSTRNNGVPAKLFPAVDDFNYAVVKVVINEEVFFLDATDKFLPFGEVPQRCLNGDARVLDLKKGSYWETIEPRFKTASRTQTQLEFNENLDLVGDLIVGKRGYFSLEEKPVAKRKTKDDFLDNFETEHPNIEVLDVDFEGLDNNEKPLRMTYEIQVDVNKSNGQLEINPFVYSQYKENPFKLKERNYPVDFGYPFSTTNVVNIKTPKGYSLKSFPNDKAFSLPNKGGRYLLKINKSDEKISLITKLEVSRKIYSSEEYYYLKEFYNQIIKSQESLIVFEKE